MVGERWIMTEIGKTEGKKWGPLCGCFATRDCKTSGGKTEQVVMG